MSAGKSLPRSLTCLALCLFAPAIAAQASSVEKVSNAQVHVVEITLPPGASEAAADPYPAMLVYMTRRPGETVFVPSGSASVRNTGAAPLTFVRTDFLTAGKQETWGTAGLPPNYKLLVENHYARAYDIRIPAGAHEPRHTHHDRVVVCLSGAQLEHILPDGKLQPSTLRTGEVVWRAGGTHVGHNLGKTDLWVIAVEPK